MPMRGRTRGGRWLPQDSLLLEGGEGKVSVVIGLHQAIEATDIGTGGYVKHQGSHACTGKAVSGDGQTTAVPVKAREGNTMKLPLRNMHH